MSAFDELKRFSDICEAVAAEAGISICVTVVDAHGTLVLVHRMSGAGVLSLEMAERKAYTSAVMGVESGSLLARIQPGQPDYTLTSSSSRLIAFGGGTSVQFGSEMFGIGISGGPNQFVDMEILAAAQDRFPSVDAVWAERTFRASGV